MVLPSDITCELNRLGIDNIDVYELMSEKHGLDFTLDFVKREINAATIFQNWHPRLVEFAAEQREKKPVPSDSQLTSQDRAWRKILEPKIRDGERICVRSRKTSIIFTAPLSVLSIVQSLWPGSVENAVFLTLEELKEWKEVDDSPEPDFPWNVRQWWDIVDRTSYNSYDDLIPFPATDALLPDEIPWLVSWGMWWASMAGGETTELWAWNGEQERFVEPVSVSSY